jgi:O-antigen ligase
MTEMSLRAKLMKLVPGIISLFLFFLSFLQPVSVICTLLLAGCWLIHPQMKQSFHKATKNPALLLLISFYVLHLISVLYSSNLQYAFFDLQTKLSFVFFPFFVSAFAFGEKEVERCKYFFVAGTIVASLLCLFFAIDAYGESHNSAYFFYEHYSHFMHPAYFTIYLNLAILFLAEGIFSASQTKKIKWVRLLVILFLFANISMLSSRTATVTAFFTCLAYLLIQVISNRRQSTSIVSFAAVIAVALMFQLTSVKFFDRYTQVVEAISAPTATQAITNDTIHVQPAESNSTTIRLQIWTSAWSLFSKNLLTGVGAGDVHDELNKEYTRNNFTRGPEQAFNPHNQFLGTAVALGIIGLLVLIALLTLPALRAWQKKSWIYVLFIAIFALNSMTESILERQAAILLFAFFFCVFAVSVYNSGEEAS